jgi:hypothetical protein
VAISHYDTSTSSAMLDFLFEKRSPFHPNKATAEICELLKQYKVHDVVGDRYAAGWVEGAFRANGIDYIPSERDRSAIYLDALPLFTSGRVRLLDNQHLIHQLISLERRTTRSNRDIIDHPPGGMDDLSNACCGALVGLQYRIDVDYLWTVEDLLGPASEVVPVNNGHDKVRRERVRLYDA